MSVTADAGLESRVYWAHKAGNEPWEWEDGAGCAERDGRFIVLDGATEAYDAVRWVDQLQRSYVQPSAERPELSREALEDWFPLMQQRWVEQAPQRFGTIFEERKFREVGSFATLLCVQIDGLDGPRPSWRAAALGDTVLFHVRADRRRLHHFPNLTPDEFGLAPDGVSTIPDMLDRMRDRLRFDVGGLERGDRIYVATDAFAEWMLRRVDTRPEAELWQLLGPGLDPDDGSEFRRLVSDLRANGELKNDDVTLLRITVCGRVPDFLVVP